MEIVKPVGSLGRNGLQDWLMQRITAVVLALYFMFLLGFFIFSPNISYQAWKALFSSEIMRFSSLIVLLSLLIHAWIGIWTVVTDYIKLLSLRLILFCLFGFGLLWSLLWGIKILWSG